MIYTVPDYYKEFSCVADQCEDTCCAGWQIVIDEKSLNKYRKIHSDYRRTVRKNVNWLTGTFRQDQEKRCAFLNDCNLCELILHEGEESLCKTCRMYPRHVEEFEGVREISLSISCPEVARVLLGRKEKVKYLTYEKEGEEEFDEFDPFLFSLLEDARKEMIAILQNRKISLCLRVLLVLGMAHDMQGRINRQELFDCFSVIEKYKKESAIWHVEKYYNRTNKAGNRFALAREMFDKLYELELLRPEWDNLLLESEVLLYSKGEAFYEDLIKVFAADEELTGEVEIQLEQLLIYFLYTYFPGAVYDGNVFSKVQMAVYCVWMIDELWMARYLKNEKSLSLEERIDFTYRFSREVEHSDQNRNRVEKMMEKKWLL